MRSTFFKGGHRPTFTWLEGGRSDEGADGEGVKVWERLPQEVYEIAKTEFPSTPCVLRPVNSSVDPWGDGASLDVHTQAESREQVRGDEPRRRCHKSPATTNTKVKTVEGNRIVNMNLTSEMLNAVYQNHIKEGQGCSGNFIFPAENEKLWGLGTTVQVRCSLCQYKSTFKLYQETESAPQKGRKTAKINLQLGAFLTKSNTAYADIRFLFATINVAPPSEHCLTNHVDNLSKYWPTINDQKKEAEL